MYDDNSNILHNEDTFTMIYMLSFPDSVDALLWKKDFYLVKYSLALTKNKMILIFSEKNKMILIFEVKKFNIFDGL